MKFRFPLIVFAAIITLTLGSGLVSAFPLFPGAGTTAGTQFEDDDLDFFVDNDSDGLITVGDVLVAAVEGTKLVDLIAPFSPPYLLNSATDELVALATVKVVASLGTDPAGRIRFGQDGATPILQFYTGGPTDFNAFGDPTMAQAIAAITDGTFLWSFSITADPDTEWFFDPIAAGANIPAAVQALPSITKVGVINYALNQVGGPGGVFASQLIGACGIFQCAGDSLVTLVGSADILGGNGRTNAFATSDADAALNPIIPEPSTLVLLGLGLLGAGFARYRKS